MKNHFPRCQGSKSVSRKRKADIFALDPVMKRLSDIAESENEAPVVKKQSKVPKVPKFSKSLKDPVNKADMNARKYVKAQKSWSTNNPYLKDNKPGKKSKKSTSQSNVSESKNCIICLENFPCSQVKQHNICDQAMCVVCLVNLMKFSKNDASMPDDIIVCPCCNTKCDLILDFYSLDQFGQIDPKGLDIIQIINEKAEKKSSLG